MDYLADGSMASNPTQRDDQASVIRLDDTWKIVEIKDQFYVIVMLKVSVRLDYKGFNWMGK